MVVSKNRSTIKRQQIFSKFRENYNSITLLNLEQRLNNDLTNVHAKNKIKKQICQFHWVTINFSTTYLLRVCRPRPRLRPQFIFDENVIYENVVGQHLSFVSPPVSKLDYDNDRNIFFQ